jgi:hypothetical protein
VVQNKKKTYVAQPGADAAGGGIWSSGTVNVDSGTTIGGTLQGQPNQALGGRGSLGQFGATGGGAGGGGSGGGLYEAGGSVTMSNSILAGNQALGGVGGAKLSYSGNTGNGGTASGGGLAVASGTLVLNNDTVQDNTAQGGNGGSGSGSGYLGNGGTASGGGIYVGGGAVTLNATTLLSNVAQGGDGGQYHFTWGVTIGALEASRGFGGSGLGGGLYVGGGSVTLTADSATTNAAKAGGSGDLGAPGGSPGVGEGGGLYILSSASLTLDAATLDAIINNTASTSYPNIAGTYNLS